MTPAPTTERRPGRSRAEQRAARREAILDATVHILATDGLGAVTHRAVAREADVPLAATTYYFASKDELVQQALDLLASAEIESLVERAARLGERLGSPGELAAGLVEVLAPGTDEGRRALLAKYELYLEAARRPPLRATSARWIAAFTQLAEAALTAIGAPEPHRRAPLMVAAIDGLLMHRLAAPDSASADRQLRERVDELVTVLTA
jgi:TetR/AcrR family transcriptional regulator, regulator of biofilm formation and stress response